MVSSVANSTVSSIRSTVSKIVNQATGRGVDVSNCTNVILPALESVAVDFSAKLASCPVDEASKGIQMMNDDLSYISYLVNLTTFAPQAINGCLSLQNVSAQASCAINYVSTTGTALTNAATTVTSMVNNAYAYVNVFPTNVAVCATNSSFSSVANAAGLGLNITGCITSKMFG